MKRKSLLVLVFAVLVCSGAFAQLRLSIGLGAGVPGGGMEFPDKYVADYINRFWIKFGASADINLGEHFFIRVERFNTLCTLSRTIPLGRSKGIKP